ncbi:MAG TPA: rod shape-determining protein MreC [Candidatus Solibacter sp.]|nr:rod shape-determining protein MreC [Candidatus Solibacter sp.]
MDVFGRYKNLIILVGVLFLQLLGLAMQVKRSTTETQDTRLIRIWAVGAITPFERALVWMQSGTGNIWHNYFYLRGVRAENRQLKEQIEHMRLEQVRLSEDATQARRLQTLLAFKEQYIAKTVAAQVIGSSGSDLSRVIYIDKGENAGLKRDMAVITADGIVGKILTVYPNVSQVLLISDQSSGVGAILEKSRLQGVLRGTPSGEIVLERVMSDETVPAGETLLTSGGDQIFPKGLPVGTVSHVGLGKELFLEIKVKPAADLSKLEEVLVLVEKRERDAVADDTHTRAADILAQRLPSVPEKPADAKPGEVKPADAKSVGGVAAGATTGTPGVKPSTQPKLGPPKNDATTQSAASKPTTIVGSPAAPTPGQVKPTSLNPAAPSHITPATGSITEIPPKRVSQNKAGTSNPAEPNATKPAPVRQNTANQNSTKPSTPSAPPDGSGPQ